MGEGKTDSIDNDESRTWSPRNGQLTLCGPIHDSCGNERNGREPWPSATETRETKDPIANIQRCDLMTEDVSPISMPGSPAPRQFSAAD